MSPLTAKKKEQHPHQSECVEPPPRRLLTLHFTCRWRPVPYYHVGCTNLGPRVPPWSQPSANTSILSPIIK